VILESSINGIPALVAKSDGPVRAGLVFRVGVADESLSMRGITHLVEHLALFRHGAADYHYNGATGPTVTHFHMQGSEDDVVRFLNEVCRSLRQLPLERLAVEKQILRTEAANHKPGLGSEFALWRYGATGNGLTCYPEWGLSKIEQEDVLEWSRKWFNRSNVVLWIAGDGIPAGLDLDLPEGPRQPLPSSTPALAATPAYFNSAGNSVAAEVVVPRGAAARVYAEVLQRVLFRQMRQEAGLSYTAATDYETWGGPDASIVAVADSLATTQSEVVHQFVETLSKLSSGSVDQSDVDAAIANMIDALSSSDAEIAWLPAHAVSLLTGYPQPDIARWRAEIMAVTAADVAEMAMVAWQSVLLMAPPGHIMERSGFEEAPQFSRFAVRGKRYRSYHPNTSLILAEDGVSVEGIGGARTVLFSQCAVVLAWPDGGRHLVGYDGIQVTIEPSLYSIGAKALAALETRLPMAVTVSMPEREAADIPRVTSLERMKIRYRLIKSAAMRGLQKTRQAWWGGFAYLSLLIPAALLGFIGFALYSGFTSRLAPNLALVAGCCVWLWYRRTRLGRW
jgi:zinc protease